MANANTTLANFKKVSNQIIIVDIIMELNSEPNVNHPFFYLAATQCPVLAIISTYIRQHPIG